MKGAIHSTKIPTGPTGKSGPPQKVDQFFRNFFGWTEPIHWVLDRTFRKFWLNGSRPKFEEGAQKFHTDDVSLSRSGQYGISVVDPQTSFRGKPVVASGNIDCFLTPQNLGRERKSNFSRENYSGWSKKSRNTLLHKEETSYCIFINMFLRRKN